MPDPAPAAVTAGGATPAEADGTRGTWAVVVASLCVVATFAASFVFFQGFLDIARLPGPVPPMDQIPGGPATAHGRLLLGIGVALYVLAAVLGLVGLVAGIRMARRPESFNRGVWAIALTACTPVLAIMLLSGMGAT